jgi:hypothetical protein
MKAPLVRRSSISGVSIRRSCRPMVPRHAERGVTIALVALAMVAIMAMAALSIDVVTLYLANAEAQRSADAAALAAARVLSLTGMTGDPANAPISTGNAWQQACTLATQVATMVAQQNPMAGVTLTPAQITVSFPNNSDPTGCASGDAAFGVNPLVTVKVQRPDVPTFFARIWGRRGASVTATATAEAFNSSHSGSVGNNGDTDQIVPVQPRCVKPWIVPNIDPGNPGTCNGSNNGGGGEGGGSGNVGDQSGGGGGGGPPACNPFVDHLNGSIQSKGIMVNGTGTGVIGRTFDLLADCKPGSGLCASPGNSLPNQPQANISPGTASLQYVPGQLPASFMAVRSCAASDFQDAIAGCDQTTKYQCGNADQQSTVDLTQNNVPSDSANGAQCLIGATGTGLGAGQDALDRSSYPYKIQSGSANPLGLTQNTVITTSNSIVSFPIYDNTNNTINGTNTSSVTVIGFLQVFINSVDTTGNSVNVTVINVTGCGNGTNATSATPVSGSSPVPVRLIQKFP